MAVERKTTQPPASGDGASPETPSPIASGGPKDTSGTSAALVNEANPTGAKNISTGKVGDDQVIHGQEHVLGDDPRRVAAQLDGFHDSLSGRPITAEGKFVDAVDGDVEVPEHRRVANNWPAEREAIGDKNKREGNTAPAK